VARGRTRRRRGAAAAGEEELGDEERGCVQEASVASWDLALALLNRTGATDACSKEAVGRSIVDVEHDRTRAGVVAAVVGSGGARVRACETETRRYSRTWLMPSGRRLIRLKRIYNF
jgi:hypothetical protein